MVPALQKAFHDSRRSMLWLAFGLGLYALFIMTFYPTLLKQSADMDKLIRSYPKELVGMFYSGNIEDFSVADPGSYVYTEFLLWEELILGAIVIAHAFNAVTNAERDGTLDVMLSLPVSRRRYLLARVLNTALIVLVVLVSSWAILAASTYIWPQFDVPIGRLALGIVGTFLPVMVVASFAYALATFLPSSARYAGPIAYLFLMGSYLLYSFSLGFDQLKAITPVFFFHYFNGGDVIKHGVTLSNALLLLAVTLVYIGLAWWRIDKKELGV